MLAMFRRSSRRGTRLGVLPLALLVCFAVPVLAQVSNAVVTGIVTDEQRGILPGVTITVTNAETGVVRTTVTEEYGRYRLGGIPPGRYNLKAELPGFATQEVKDITLTIGLEYTRDFSMGIQGRQESITITGEAPVIETTKTETTPSGRGRREARRVRVTGFGKGLRPSPFLEASPRRARDTRASRRPLPKGKEPLSLRSPSYGIKLIVLPPIRARNPPYTGYTGIPCPVYKPTK